MMVKHGGDLTGNDFSTECVYRIHSLLLELIEYSCNVGAWKAIESGKKCPAIPFGFLRNASWKLNFLLLDINMFHFEN